MYVKGGTGNTNTLVACEKYKEKQLVSVFTIDNFVKKQGEDYNDSCIYSSKMWQ